MAKNYSDDLLDDGGSESTESPRKSKSHEGTAEALINKSVFPEAPEVGKVCKFRVEKVTDDQVLVSYVSSESEEEEPEEAEGEEMMGPPSEMDEMMT